MIDFGSVDRLIELALEEDKVHDDLTSRLTVDADKVGKARIHAKEDLIFCGSEVIKRIIVLAGAELEFNCLVKEGQNCGRGTTLATLKGKIREILSLERVILNFLQRLSGIATMTSTYVQRAGELDVLDTRKTTPGWRYLEKYAVRAAGGQNHRMNLSDLILVKNNHFDANGGNVSVTLERVFRDKPPYVKVEVEVRNSEELAEALKFPVDVIMLDNFKPEEIEVAVKSIRKVSHEIYIECSGGINLESIEKFKSRGANAISTSAITAQARTVDIALAVEM